MDLYVSLEAYIALLLAFSAIAFFYLLNYETDKVAPYRLVFYVLAMSL